MNTLAVSSCIRFRYANGDGGAGHKCMSWGLSDPFGPRLC